MNESPVNAQINRHAYRASPRTAFIDGVAPSPPGDATSKREKLKARAGAQPSNPCQRRSHAARTRPASQGGAPRALAAAKFLRKTPVSVDQRPPTSTLSTTNLARPRSPVNSRFVLSFLLLACDRAFPLVVAEPLRATPTRESGDTMVVSTALYFSFSSECFAVSWSFRSISDCACLDVRHNSLDVVSACARS